MKLENLKKFDWMNEPNNVRFGEDGMNVEAKFRTDFWCCSRYNFYKDDGHFFYSYVLGDFCTDLDWEFDFADKYSQCGLMIRVDVRNWFKISIMCENEDDPLLSTSLTVDGLSDLANVSLSTGIKRIWYRLKKIKGCYIASYSLDGVNYIQVRKFYLLHDSDEVKVGAYICSPQNDDFCAVLRNIEIY